MRENLFRASFFSAVFLSTVSVFFVGHHIVKAQIGGGLPASNVSLYGSAWSSNIGWVSFNSCEVNLSEGTENCPPSSVDYSVQVNSSTGNLTGSAWSSNIGWLQFGGLSSFPSGSGTESVNANIVFGDGKVRGWARFLAGADDPDDGWDGWVSMSGNNHSSPQLDGNGGVTYDPNLGKLIGATWGGPVVGWLYFGDRTNSWPNVWYGLPDAQSEIFDYSISNSSPDYEIAIPAGTSADVSVNLELVSGNSEGVTIGYNSDPFDGIFVSQVEGDNPCNPNCNITLRISVGESVADGQYSFIVSGSLLDKTTEVRFTVPDPQDPPPDVTDVTCSAEGESFYGGKFFFLYDTVIWRVEVLEGGGGEGGEGGRDEYEYVWSGDGGVDICDGSTCEVSYVTVGPKFTQVSVDGGIEFYDCPVTFIIPGGLFFREI